jgi:hypothetical protein
MPSLRKCPNCACGFPLTSSLCEYCSAILAVGEERDGLRVASLVCNHCGGQNDAQAKRCSACNQDLFRACPRCRGEIPHVTGGSCPRCGLLESRFFEECLRLESQKQRARARIEKRNERLRIFFLMLYLGVALLFGVASWLSHSAGDGAQRDGLLAASLVSFILWLSTLALSKSSSRKGQ